MNYRQIQKINHRKTNIVIFLYLLIFTSVGLLGETISYSTNYIFDSGLIDAMGITFNAIITKKHFPIFMIIMIILSVVIIIITIKFGNKILLAGNKYTQINNKENLDSSEKMLLNIIEELVISSRIRFMPDVYIVEENYMNAFASGWMENSSLVAITRGLLDKLNRAEIQAVMAHEIAHIKNADIRLTLVVGILTNVMVYAVDYIYYISLRGSSRNKAMQQARIIIFILKFLLPILTIVLQMYISRTREYLADAGSVEFTGDQDAMISALRKISSDYEENDYDIDETENQTRRFANFFDYGYLFSTHPSVENRILSLQGKLK